MFIAQTKKTKSQISKNQKTSQYTLTPTIKHTNAMTSPHAINQLEAAEARKRKADESAKANARNKGQRLSAGKKTNQTKSPTTNNNDNTQNASDNITTDDNDVEMHDNFVRKHKILYTMKLRTNGGIEPLKILQKTLQEWYKTMKSCVNSFVLYKTTTMESQYLISMIKLRRTCNFFDDFSMGYSLELAPAIFGLLPRSVLTRMKTKYARVPCGGTRKTRL